MKVYVSPLAVAALPDAGFFEAVRLRVAAGIDALNQAHVADDGRVVAEQSDSRRAQRVGSLGRAAGQFEVEAVEVEALDQLPAGLRLEGGERRIAQHLVRIPITAPDRVKQLPSQVDYLLLGPSGFGGVHSCSSRNLLERSKGL